MWRNIGSVHVSYPYMKMKNGKDFCSLPLIFISLCSSTNFHKQISLNISKKTIAFLFYLWYNGASYRGKRGDGSPRFLQVMEHTLHHCNGRAATAYRVYHSGSLNSSILAFFWQTDGYIPVGLLHPCFKPKWSLRYSRKLFRACEVNSSHALFSCANKNTVRRRKTKWEQ